MTRKIVEGGAAMAEAIKLCQPKVFAFYPITPSTPIPHALAKIHADGGLGNAEVIMTESEHSSISACAGASATGVRTFTATSSQGLALMHEVLFTVSGMRLPVVMAVANRSLSAPLNIFNDWQDSISERDAGWIQIYVETVQEAVDTLIQAYKIAEDERVLLPVMVCMDGFYLTHVFEPADVPDALDGFLPDYNPKHAFLDPVRPITQGAWAMQETYFRMRKELSQAIDKSSAVVKQVHDDFAKKFGRAYGDGLVEKIKGGKTVFLTMGSTCSTLRQAAEESAFGIVRVRCYRPFPTKSLLKALEGTETIIVFEKDVSLGTNRGALFTEVRDALKEYDVKTVCFLGGFGGTDTTLRDIEKMFVESAEMKDGEVRWLK